MAGSVNGVWSMAPQVGSGNAPSAVAGLWAGGRRHFSWPAEDTRRVGGAVDL